MTMWGIHNDTLGPELVEEGFISLGYEGLGDLRTIGDAQAAMKAALATAYPNAKPGALPVWAGVLRRFAFEMGEGDRVVAPYKRDRTLNFGIVEGPYEYHPNAEVHQHRRRVRWVKTGVARGLFPQPALYEIGSAVTLFQVKHHAAVFARYMEAQSDDAFEAAAGAPTSEAAPSEEAVTEALNPDQPNADRIDQHTRDFVQRVLLKDLSHSEFEEFTADLLRALGYQARVTPYSADGGIDVIAHKDSLGVEPPIIKVRCKHTASTHGRPDVQQLIGTLDSGEAGLFVTLGSYSKEAVSLERERQNLRLLSGADVTDLTIAHYDALPARWRSRMPLRPVLVVDLDPEAG